MNRRVQVESPYAGDVAVNVAYARACMLDSLRRNEAPFLSHLLYVQVLDDLVPEERSRGIFAGLAWGLAAHLTAVYTDLGISHGMRLGIRAAEEANRPIEFRSLGTWTAPPMSELTDVEVLRRRLFDAEAAIAARDLRIAEITRGERA